MVLLDLQITAAKLLSIIRNQIYLAVSGLCFTEPIEANLFGSTISYYIDHIEVPRKDGFIDGSTFPSLPSPGGFLFRSNESRETSVEYAYSPGDGTVSRIEDSVTIQKKLQIVIPIQLHLKTQSMIENNEKAIASVLTIVNLHIDVYGEMNREIWPYGHSLIFRLDKIAFNLLEDLVSPEQKEKLRVMLTGLASVGVGGPGGSQGVNIDAVYYFLHPHRMGEPAPPIEVYNMGVSADSALSVLDIRHEFDFPSESALDSWDNFHNTPGNVGVLAEGKDWSILIPGNAIANAAAQRFQFGLEVENNKDEDDKRIDVLIWPTATWIPIGSGQIETKFDIDVIKGHPCPNNIGVEVTTTTSLSLVEIKNLAGYNLLGELQYNTTTAVQGISEMELTNIYNEDVIACTFELPSGGVPVLANMIGAIVADAIEPDFKELMGKNTPSECVWVEPPPDEPHTTMVCKYAVSMPLQSFNFDSLIALPSGLLCAGTIFVDEPLVVDPVTGQHQTQPIWWYDNPTFGEHYDNFCHSDLRSLIARLGILAVYPCKIKFEDDFVNQFSHSVRYDGDELILQIEGYEIVQPIYNDDGTVKQKGYFDDPYPCKVTVYPHAYVEIHHFVIPPFERMEELTLEQAAKNVELRLEKCNPLVEYQPFHVFKPKWWVDPPPDEILKTDSVVEHLWKVNLLDVDPQHGVTIRDVSGNIMAAAKSSLKGIGELGAITSPSIDGKDVSIHGEFSWP